MRSSRRWADRHVPISSCTLKRTRGKLDGELSRSALEMGSELEGVPVAARFGVSPSNRGLGAPALLVTAFSRRHRRPLAAFKFHDIGLGIRYLKYFNWAYNLNGATQEPKTRTSTCCRISSTSFHGTML